MNPVLLVEIAAVAARLTADAIEAMRARDDAAAVAALERFASTMPPALEAALADARQARADSEARVAAALAAEDPQP